MTTPAERTRSVIQARAFLNDIDQDLSLPESVRNEARRLLRHYPSQEEVLLAGKLEESAGKETVLPPIFSSVTGMKKHEDDWQL